MVERYAVRAIDMETGEGVTEGPFRSERVAMDRAERWAAEMYGDAAVTWFGQDAASRYHIGMLFADQAHTTPVVTFVIMPG